MRKHVRKVCSVCRTEARGSARSKAWRDAALPQEGAEAALAASGEEYEGRTLSIKRARPLPSSTRDPPGKGSY